MPRPSRRLLGVLAWLAATAAATAVGLFAVGAVGAGIVDRAAPVLSPAQVDALLAAAPSPAAPGAASTIGPGSPPQVLASPGGSVVARCVAGAVEIVSATPAQGFRLDDRDRSDEVKFESAAADVTMRLSCAGDRPVAQTQVDPEDD